MEKNYVSKKNAEKAVTLLKNVCKEFSCETCIIKKMIHCEGTGKQNISIPAEWENR